MTSKWAINEAVRESDLPPPSRLIMLTLSDVADAKTGVIPLDRTPSLRELSEWTGYDKSTVTRHLDSLDAAGWVVRDRPDAAASRAEHIRTTYRLTDGRGAQDATETDESDDDPVVQSAPSPVVQRTPRDGDSRGAENTMPSPTRPFGHGAENTMGMVQSAPLPYTQISNRSKNLSSSGKTPTKASKKSRPKKPKSKPDRPDVEKICNHLADRMVGNGCVRPTITDKWRTEARLLLDKDGRTLEQVIRAIDWCQDDPFWKGNIKSTQKLREQYDTLRQHAQRKPARASPGSHLTEVNGLHLKPANVEAIARQQRMQAIQAEREAQQKAIGGTS